MDLRNKDLETVSPSSSRVRESSKKRLIEKRLDELKIVNDGDRLKSNATALDRAAGYFKLNRTHDAHMFYMFFEKRGQNKKEEEVIDEDKIPLILWLTGGPGCSSELAAFVENGPYFVVDNDDKSSIDKYALKETEFGWDTIGHLLYVDQPVNTGFSYSTSADDDVRDSSTVAEDLFDFLQEFLLSRPELADNPVYITGESYAGHYVPAVAFRIYKALKNDENDAVNINLKGFAVGNGLTDPEIQYAAYVKYSVGVGIVSEAQGNKINEDYLETCVMKAKMCNEENGKNYTKKALTKKCIDAVDYCQRIPGTLLQVAAENKGGKPINVYDVRKECVGELCYDFSKIGEYLNQKSTRKALGISPDFKKWETCNMNVHEKMMADWMHNYENIIPEMLENGVRGMIYAGESDFICNWNGNLEWTRNMEWSGKEDFTKKFSSPFVIDSESGWTGGEVIETDGRLSFVKVSQAGHMVPMDQPRVSRDMIKRFVNEEKIATGTTSK